MDGELEPRRGHRASPACHRETTQSCEGQRFHSVTNRVHLTCTPGSVGDLGGGPPRSTRPMTSWRGLPADPISVVSTLRPICLGVRIDPAASSLFATADSLISPSTVSNAEEASP